MTTSRYYNSFFITLFLFSSLIFGIFLLFQNKTIYAQNISKNEQKISFTIISQKPQPIEQKIVEEQVKKIEPIIPPKPIAKKPLKQEIVKEKQTQQEIIKEVTPITNTDTKPTETIIEKQISQAPQIDTNAIKEEFLKNIKIKIDKNKVYPPRAISRGIQGIIDVSFTLLSSGDISNINLQGHNIFKASIEDALQKSFPVTIPHELDVFPMVINLKIAFNLR
ncbi:MAG: energy transducer TonB [Arcobacteraceae bacterium]|nr:energy transducer TonB [Arcobacteraceae bacterium]MDY0328422.1 energy transducer TonB [Arcobacteraceae bacterium]